MKLGKNDSALSICLKEYYISMGSHVRVHICTCAHTHTHTHALDQFLVFIKFTIKKYFHMPKLFEII
jgi:hypothetical protein